MKEAIMTIIFIDNNACAEWLWNLKKNPSHAMERDCVLRVIRLRIFIIEWRCWPRRTHLISFIASCEFARTSKRNVRERWIRTSIAECKRDSTKLIQSNSYTRTRTFLVLWKLAAHSRVLSYQYTLVSDLLVSVGSVKYLELPTWAPLWCGQSNTGQYWHCAYELFFL